MGWVKARYLVRKRKQSLRISPDFEGVLVPVVFLISLMLHGDCL